MPGRRVHSVAGRVLAGALGAVVAGAAVGVAVLTEDPSSAGTVLAEADGAALVDPTGAVRSTPAGSAVPDGTSVRVPVDGSATLTTRSRGETRRLVLGPGALYRVVDGVTGVLVRGDAVVDRDEGPPLSLRAAGTSVTVGDGTVVRVDRRYALRVATFRGEAGLRGDGGRRADVRALQQVVQPGRALPSQPAPLALRGDALDRAADAALVADDRALVALARRLDSTGDAIRLLRVTPATFLAGAPAAAPGEPVSETALPRALARAAADDPADEAERYAEARRVRAGGGAWGVAARVVGADADDVPSAVSALLAGPVLAASAAVPVPLVAGIPGGATGGTGSGPGGGAAGGPDGEAGGSGGTGGPGGTDDTDGAGGTDGTGDGGDDGGGSRPRTPGDRDPAPRPTPSQQPSPSPTQEPSPHPTEDPVGFVLHVLRNPTPLPTPSGDVRRATSPAGGEPVVRAGVRVGVRAGGRAAAAPRSRDDVAGAATARGGQREADERRRTGAGKPAGAARPAERAGTRRPAPEVSAPRGGSAAVPATGPVPARPAARRPAPPDPAPLPPGRAPSSLDTLVRSLLG